MKNPIIPNDFNDFMLELAKASSDIILPLFRSALHSEDKSQGKVFDPVTVASADDSIQDSSGQNGSGQANGA